MEKFDEVRLGLFGFVALMEVFFLKKKMFLNHGKYFFHSSLSQPPDWGYFRMGNKRKIVIRTMQVHYFNLNIR